LPRPPGWGDDEQKPYGADKTEPARFEAVILSFWACRKGLPITQRPLWFDYRAGAFGPVYGRSLKKNKGARLSQKSAMAAARHKHSVDPLEAEAGHRVPG